MNQLQVEFLGLAHNFCSSLYTGKMFWGQKSMDTEKNFTVVREVLRNLIVLEISPRNSTLFTGLFLAGRHTWAGQETRHHLMQEDHSYVTHTVHLP